MEKTGWGISDMYWAAIPGFISLIGIVAFTFTLLSAKAKGRDIGKHVTGLAVSLTLLLASMALIVENVLFYDKYEALEDERDQLQAAVAALEELNAREVTAPPEDEPGRQSADEDIDTEPAAEIVWSESIEFDASNKASVTVTKDEGGALSGLVSCEFDGANTLLENIRVSVFASEIITLGVNDFSIKVTSGVDSGEYVYTGGVLSAQAAIPSYTELNTNDYIEYWDALQSIKDMFEDVIIQ